MRWRYMRRSDFRTEKAWVVHVAELATEEFANAWERACGQNPPYLPYHSGVVPSVSVALTSRECAYCGTTLHVHDQNCRNCGAP